MGFLTRLFGFSSLPRWMEMLPAHLRPTASQIERLETLRQRIGTNDEEFAFHVAGHPATTRKLQHYIYDQLKNKFPRMTPHELLAELVRSRWVSSTQSGYELFGLSECSEGERARRIYEIASRAGSVDALADLFIREESAHNIGPAPGFEWAGQEVTRILNE